MFENVLISMLKHFAPTIKEQCAPFLTGLLKNLFDEYSPRLEDNEETVDVVIQFQNDIPYFLICSMSSDNQVIRCFDAFTIEELIEKGEAFARKNKLL